MGKATKLQRQLRQNQLLNYFEGDFYQEKKIGNQYFVKQFNRSTGRWQVAIFSEGSFAKYKAFNTNKKLDQKFISKVGAYD